MNSEHRQKSQNNMMEEYEESNHAKDTYLENLLEELLKAAVYSSAHRNPPLTVRVIE